MINESKRCNELTGKEWLQNSFSIWRNIQKSKEEKDLKHPAMYPIALCEKLISTFSKEGNIVIDPFSGIGSTVIAASNLNRKGIGIELSEEFCMISQSRLESDNGSEIINGDNIQILKGISHNSIDLCITSPPYWDILNMKRSADNKQSKNYSNNERDLGNVSDYKTFINDLGDVFELLNKVLKQGSYCVVNVMDIRKKDKFFPFHIDIITELQKRGYFLDDIIIWDRQHEYNNMRPLGYPYKFRINKVHEYLLIFIVNK